jgi:glycosyltransferase involved in cell wall biosynthesis
LTSELERWIDDFKPDLIYTILGSNAFMEMTRNIERRFGIPVVVHMMDDWPGVLYRRGLLASFERSQMQRLLRRIVSTAALNMGIGTAMCRAFSERYGRPFVPFQNCVDLTRWRDLLRSNSVVGARPYRLVYFGSIFVNAQLSSLIDVCRAVARLDASGPTVRLDIVTPQFIAAPFRHLLEVSSCVRLVEPSGDDHEFFAALAKADALILPVNFDPESVAFIRYSMPTKVPAYMASGTPVLVYGPRGVAQVDYAADERWAEVVDEKDPGKLDDGLRRILLDPAQRERLRARAQKLANANHDSNRVRAAFQNALKSVVRPRS